MVNPIKPLVTQETRLHDLQIEREKEFINALKPVSVESGADLAGFGPGNLQANTGQATGGSFLPISGGVMNGPIGFNPILVEIVSNTVDLTRTTGLFTGRLILNGEGGDIADIIEKFVGGNNDFPGRMISIQGTVGETITFKHLFNGGGGGDVRTPNGIDFILVGEDNVTLIYDIVNDEWAFMDGGLAVVVAGANKALSNLDAQTSINSNLDPSTPGVRLIGDATNYWRGVHAQEYNLISGGTQVSTDTSIVSDVNGMILGVPINDLFTYKVAGVTKATLSASQFNLSNIILLDNAAGLALANVEFDPVANGELRLNSSDAKIHSGGEVKNFSKMPEIDEIETISGLWTFTNSIFNVNSSSIFLGDSSGDNLTITAQINSDFIADADDTYDIGKDTLRWQALYLGTLLDIVEGFAAGTAPVGSTNRAKLFCRPSAGGKTEFRVKFQTGTSVLIAIEP